MSFSSIVKELREIKDGVGNMSRRLGGKHWYGRARSHIAPDQTPLEPGPIQQGRWATLPPELLLDIIRRVEESETTWPARAVVVHCASVCRSWRYITKEVVKTLEQCGRLTFPISLKQPGPRESPIQCFIRRDSASSLFMLYYGLVPSEDDSDKLLLAAKRIRRATCTEFVISLVADDFSRASKSYVGKLRSNMLGSKFTIIDGQLICEMPTNPVSRKNFKFHFRQGLPRLPAHNYCVGTITYQLNVLRTRGPRRMHCVMHSIPVTSIEVGGSAPTPTSFPVPETLHSQFSVPMSSNGKERISDCSSTSLSDSPILVPGVGEPLILKNKAPRWHEQLQCWCLNFRGRVTVASVKNFQLVAALEPSHNVPAEEQEKVILQFGKIGKDIFTMDYCYPLSAFQAFAICLSSFDTKPVCE